MADSRAIGVFDSGLGGLSVLEAVQRELPGESTVYLGDTARVPYGTRSGDVVVRYALNNALTLAEKAEIKALVVACNTASSVALGPLAERLPIPVLGVIEPGARAAVEAVDDPERPEPTVLVIGTPGTVASGAYDRSLASLGLKSAPVSIACPLFVPLVEEGWTSGSVPRQVAERYLADVPSSVEVCVLGCTHYPHLREVISAVLGPSVAVVDGGQATAKELRSLLSERELLATPAAGDPPSRRILVTDRPAGGLWGAHEVELVDVRVTA